MQLCRCLLAADTSVFALEQTIPFVWFLACNSFFSNLSLPKSWPNLSTATLLKGDLFFLPISCSFKRIKIQEICFSFITHHTQAAQSCNWSPPCLLMPVTHTHLYTSILQCLTIYRHLKDTTSTEYIDAKFPFLLIISQCLHLLIIFFSLGNFYFLLFLFCFRPYIFPHPARTKIPYFSCTRQCEWYL